MVTPEYVFFYISVILAVIVTVLGNLLVIISVCHFKQLHTPTNVLILSLAVADFMVGLFVMPLGFIWLVEACWLFGTYICAFFNFFAFLLTAASVHNVALIAVDRYLALNNPFLYTKQITVNFTVSVVLFTWAVSVGYNVSILYCNGIFTTLLTLCPSECPIAFSKIWSLVDFVVVFALPCSIMIILYLKIFAIARKHANAIRAANGNQINVNGSKNENMPKRSERKAARVLGILVFVFLLCVVPYFTASVMARFINGQVFEIVLKYMSLILYLNSMFNPIIYALFYPWFQNSVKLTLRCRICTPESSFMQLK
ncbi:trace amine-associated receptor 13c-like [Alosa sapidissima]|uniref:trace amine-associated receptor 13c-like n=1 Tax=Alosa sapidissima TaxID=34773 RepID=UPI001C083B58|nr:trace amine-associated receptor 13c-like [Alosa sapidissima]